MANKLALDIEKFIIDWNQRYPYDRYIRKKYGIMFGSTEHKKLNFINMAIEFKEDIVIKRIEEETQSEEEQMFFKEFLPGEKVDGEIPGKKIVKIKKKDLDKEFDDLDITQFNDPVITN